MATDTTKIKQMIIRIASEEGVDPALALAVAENESGFNPNARNKTSKEDSIGLFQINRMAHPDYKGGTNLEANIRYGVKYLKGQLARANGNPQVALAAYNGGWGGRNSSQAKGYAQKVLNIANKKYDKVAKNASQTPLLYGGATKTDGITGAASPMNLSVPDPTKPNYTDLFATTAKDPTGQSNARYTAREISALKNITAPVEVPQDIRPNVVIGQNEDGTPQVVTAAEYAELLNQRDMADAAASTQAFQQSIPDLAKTEVQLGGQNAYDTLKGLKDSYVQKLAQDPRIDLDTLTPEQALDVQNRMNARYNWGGNPDNLSAADYYKSINALKNRSMSYADALAIAQDRYNRELAIDLKFQEAALALTGNNQQLAQEVLKQAQAGNTAYINALQKTVEARMKNEADLNKQRQSDHDTLLNTQRQGMNTFFNQLPQTELDAAKMKNQFELGKYGTDASIYNTNVGALRPYVEEDAMQQNPLRQQEVLIKQQQANTSQQNANTMEANAANAIMANSQFNPQGMAAGAAVVPSMRGVLGNPNATTINQMFGNVEPAKSTTPAFFTMFRQD